MHNHALLPFHARGAISSQVGAPGSRLVRSHLRQRRLGWRQPEDHVHAAVHRDGGRQLGVSLLPTVSLGVQCAQATVGSAPGAGACPVPRPGWWPVGSGLPPGRLRSSSRSSSSWNWTFRARQETRPKRCSMAMVCVRLSSHVTTTPPCVWVRSPSRRRWPILVEEPRRLHGGGQARSVAADAGKSLDRHFATAP
jgi:hypothetical protein